MPRPVVWDPMHCSTPDSSPLHCLPVFVQIHMHWVGDPIQPSHPLPPLPLLPSVFPSLRVLSNTSTIKGQRRERKSERESRGTKWGSWTKLWMHTPVGTGQAESDGPHSPPALLFRNIKPPRNQTAVGSPPGSASRGAQQVGQRGGE